MKCSAGWLSMALALCAHYGSELFGSVYSCRLCTNRSPRTQRLSCRGPADLRTVVWCGQKLRSRHRLPAVQTSASSPSFKGVLRLSNTMFPCRLLCRGLSSKMLKVASGPPFCSRSPSGRVKQGEGAARAPLPNCLDTLSKATHCCDNWALHLR